MSAHRSTLHGAPRPAAVLPCGPWAAVLRLAFARSVVLLLLLSGCGPPAPPAGPSYATTPLDGREHSYRLAVHPLHNPQKLLRAYQPLIEHLQRELPSVHFQLEASRDYAAFEAKLRRRDPELLLPNPWQTLQAMAVGYSVIAMAGDAEDFRGLILVRRDSPVQRPRELVGKAVGFPSPTALAACIMPQYFLHEQGLDVQRELTSLYVGSQESSIMSVHQRRAAAAATWPPPWRAFQIEHPREAAELKVIWETKPLLNNSVMVRDDVPVAVRDGLRRALVSLNDSQAGRAVLASMQTARFHPSDNRRYESVRDYVARFERDVRPVEAPP